MDNNNMINNDQNNDNLENEKSNTIIDKMKNFTFNSIKYTAYSIFNCINTIAQFTNNNKKPIIIGFISACIGTYVMGRITGKYTFVLLDIGKINIVRKPLISSNNI